jgi:NADP-dependent 3-hydroxy acid dehydrogenase YdfG
MQTTRDLAGSVVAITGATAGIGRETARLLVADGARVALGGRRTDRLDELVAELGAENAVGVPMDVRVPADNARLVAAAVDRWGRLDSVVPNAGIGMYGGILDQSDDDLATMMDTNYAGTVWTVRAALPAMLAAGGGDIVIVSSVAGFRGGDDDPRASEWLTPVDVAAAIVTTLHQPRTMRTSIWTMWSMGQGS